ncbi:cryptochrome/photolyase family protein [Candidatus Pelagibacter sp. FZCC0015]|uniref:cryptochrome/photolyase family protein n=1 Tax=Candidatus Pelagibacter sp. FZCC0015 TaxID=2268451 RepID=UPI0011A3C059|nr:deoxyribodipyrimidine photo-lyase [Candidatus Pelagibacter sp. FZCC0015]
MSNTGIFWIREDFRIENNPALSFATQNHDNVIALYVYNNNDFDNKREAQKWWVFKSLETLKKELSDYKINLEIVKGDELEIFSKFNKKDKLSVYWNKIYEPDVIAIGKKIRDIFIKNEINYKYFKGNILNEFQEITKNDGTPFKVFTPFWRNAEQVYLNKPPSKNYIVKKKTKKISYFKKCIEPNDILPKKNWYKKFDKYWKVSENDSKKILKNLIEKKIKDYGTSRDIPSIEGTSKLSPYIKHGQIHVGSIWKKCSEIKSKGIGYRKYINELGWREFSHSLINYFPEFLKGNFRKEFDKFPWAKNEKFLKAWKRGMTGYPIVDAGMRELYETGWMHNRIRMVVGSFLVKHLRINWTEGEKHFRNCLLDFNKANNVAQWQWVAGCGADAAPYFRIFNPILQGEKFDKEGNYVKKWVPELKNVPNKFIHKPWEMELKYQEAIKTIIGKDYPGPIVVHEKARAAALEAFQSLKKK